MLFVNVQFAEKNIIKKFSKTIFVLHEQTDPKISNSKYYKQHYNTVNWDC